MKFGLITPGSNPSKERRITSLLLPVLLAFTLFLVAAGKKSGEKDLLENLDLFTDVVAMIQEEYYRDVEPAELMMGATGGMMASLDRYSHIKKKGEIGSAGIGIEIAIEDNALTVVTAVAGGPAAKGGIIHGDKIVKIDGDVIGNVTLDDVRRMLHGEPDTEVALTLYREGAKGTRDVVLNRQKVVSPGLVKSEVRDGEVGYVRLASLPSGTGREFIQSVEKLRGEGIERLVVDLRDNPGGNIEEAAAIAGYLIGDGKRIASIESRLDSERKEIRAPKSRPPDISIAVLVNGGTAGAAEVIAGAIKNSGRPVVIGSKTFGDGSVQKDIPLDDTLSLHLTVGRYVVSGEKSFDGVGIVPDVEVVIGPENEELLQKIREGVEMDEKERPADSQLDMAIDLLKGLAILDGRAGQ